MDRVSSRVGSAEQIDENPRYAGRNPVLLEDGLPWDPNVTRWSPAGDSILYSAEDGVYLISSEGKAKRKLSSRSFRTFNFAKEGSQVYGFSTTRPKGWSGSFMR